MEHIDNKDEKEIGYRIEPKFWGQGLATEAASAVVQCIVERANIASVKVLEKLGM